MPAPRAVHKISGMDQLATQDRDRILQCLHTMPMTVAQIGQQLHLNSTRVTRIIQTLKSERLIHAPRCIKGPKGNTVNLWEIHPSLKSPE